MDAVGALVLAAGSSSRLGEPKQLVKYEGKSLVQRVINELEAVSEIDGIVVVTGAVKLSDGGKTNPNTEIIHYKEWEKGMGASLKFGLEYLMNSRSNLAGCLIMPVDQPLVTRAHIQKIISLWQKDGRIAAARYEGITGTPAVFGKAYFPRLMKINDSNGARTLLRENERDISTMELPEAAFDIDTPEDLSKLNEKK